MVYDIGKDKNSNDIKEKYKITAYPTIVFLDSNAVECSRILGAPKTVDDFIKSTLAAIDPKNSWSFKRKKYETDPSYALEYVKLLLLSGMKKDATITMNEIFEKRGIEENFAEESVDIYKTILTEFDSPILIYMLENKKIISNTMGEDAYNTFIDRQIADVLLTDLLNVKFHRLNYNDSPLKRNIEFAKNNPSLKTSFATILSDNIDSILKNDLSSMFASIKKEYNNLSFNNIEILILLTEVFAPKVAIEKYNEELKDFCISCLKKETNDDVRTIFENKIRILNL